MENNPRRDADFRLFCHRFCDPLVSDHLPSALSLSLPPSNLSYFAFHDQFLVVDVQLVTRRARGPLLFPTFGQSPPRLAPLEASGTLRLLPQLLFLTVFITRRSAFPVSVL